MIEIVKTEDGSDTLYIPSLNEHYHSVHGAVTESEHIYLNAGFNSCSPGPLHIFEAGFGTGLNALLTAIRSASDKREVFYTAAENFPLSREITDSLNYPDFISDRAQIFRMIHSSPWNEFNKIHEHFSLCKIRCDLTTDTISGRFNLIYFDAFGPDKQPGMWSDEVFQKISGLTEKNGVLVTYSSKGEVKRRLKKYGFEVSLLPGPRGKRHIIRAIKI